MLQEPSSRTLPAPALDKIPGPMGARFENSLAPYRSLRAIRARSPPPKCPRECPRKAGCAWECLRECSRDPLRPGPKCVQKVSKKTLFGQFYVTLEGPQGHFSRHFRAHPGFWRHSLGHSQEHFGPEGPEVPPVGGRRVLMGARFLSSTGLQFGTLIGRTELLPVPALDNNWSPKSQKGRKGAGVKGAGVANCRIFRSAVPSVVVWSILLVSLSGVKKKLWQFMTRAPLPPAPFADSWKSTLDFSHYINHLAWLRLQSLAVKNKLFGANLERWKTFSKVLVRTFSAAWEGLNIF